MKKVSNLLFVAALVLSHLMCIVVAYNYRDMLCGIQHSCYSAPAWVAFLGIIPYGLGIIVCVLLAYILRRKAK